MEKYWSQAINVVNIQMEDKNFESFKWIPTS